MALQDGIEVPRSYDFSNHTVFDVNRPPAPYEVEQACCDLLEMMLANASVLRSVLYINKVQNGRSVYCTYEDGFEIKGMRC